MDTNNWYKDGYFWRDPSPGWEIRMRGCPSDGKGDLIFNTMYKIITDEDRSEWAYKALLYCWILLVAERRWLVRMDQSCDAKTRLHWRWSSVVWRHVVRDKQGYLNKFGNFCKRIGLPVLEKYRHPRQMTRDPYTAVFACCIFLKREHYISKTTLPLYLYRPNFWAWHKYLKTKKPIYLKIYRFWCKFSSSKKDYVIRLKELREMTLEN